jgi:hypothetical protein
MSFSPLRCACSSKLPVKTCLRSQVAWCFSLSAEQLLALEEQRFIAASFSSRGIRKTEFAEFVAPGLSRWKQVEAEVGNEMAFRTRALMGRDNGQPQAEDSRRCDRHGQTTDQTSNAHTEFHESKEGLLPIKHRSTRCRLPPVTEHNVH